jgi:putative tryptophan/tyrosine transport system substrate-binding protein
MRRREFIKFLGSAAAAWPISAHAQQRERVRRIGILLPFDDERHSQVQLLLPVFKQRLRDLGWIEGRNIVFGLYFTGQDAGGILRGAAKAVASTPDLIVAWANPNVAALKQATQSIPIIFTQVSDPDGSGFVANLARPGGNITGFQNFEPVIGGKWLELLKEIAPGVHRVAVIYNQSIAANVAILRAIEAASASMGLTVRAFDLHEAADIEPALTAFAREPNGGLLVGPNPFNSTNRELITSLAARLNLPAVYPFSLFSEVGGLISYGVDRREQQRGAAAYVDRILKGEKPADLPVQAPTKYQLVINLKTAKAMGIDVSLQFQQRADEVIE